MRRTLLPLGCVIMLACMLWQWGHLSSFELRLAQVKKEIKLRLKAGVPEYERVHFSFSAQEAAALHWVKPDKEFKWKDRFYDVVERFTDGNGRIIFACIDDRQEATLFAGLAILVDRTMEDRSDSRSTSVRIIASWKVLIPELVRPNAAPIVPCVQHSEGALDALLAAHARLYDPPPRA